MIPLKDYNPTRRFAFVTALLIAVNIGVYIFVQRPFTNDEVDNLKFSYRYAAIPCEVVAGRPLTGEEVDRTFRNGDATACDRTTHASPDQEVFPQKSVWLAVLYSMFLHGSLLHIGGNMLYFWVFGNNIEDRMGPFLYLVFYLAAGVIAALAHILVQPNSTVPVVGASGAIAGVMGAYLVLFPKVRIKSLLGFIPLDIPAQLLLIFWFITQFFTGAGSSVAWVAHVGGFIFGALVAFVFRDRLRPPRVTPTFADL